MSDTESIDNGLPALDQQSTSALVAGIVGSQRDALDRLLLRGASLASAVDAAAERLGAGEGRLVMVGAGASGRICVQDGAELWPTFGWPHERLELVMAGGSDALVHSIEGVEDDAAAARQQATALRIGAMDVVVGVAASGRSPWTVEWIETAAQHGALTIGISGNAATPLLAAAGYGIALSSGPEVLAGSTRLAAGTSQKAALNAFSTALMIRLNRSYGNLMVDMAARNAKLDVRRQTMLKAIVPDATDEAVADALVEADGWVKLAVLLLKGDSVEQARERLAGHAGSLRLALAALAKTKK